MSASETPWSSDVPISMPMPTDQEVGVEMSGFVFTEGGIAHGITQDSYARLSTPDFAPTRVPNLLIYEDTDLDAPPSSMEVF